MPTDSSLKETLPIVSLRGLDLPNWKSINETTNSHGVVKAHFLSRPGFFHLPGPDPPYSAMGGISWRHESRKRLSSRTLTLGSPTVRGRPGRGVCRGCPGHPPLRLFIRRRHEHSPRY